MGEQPAPFPRIAVTEYHKLGGCRQQKCIIFHFGAQKSEIRCQQGHASSEVLDGIPPGFILSPGGGPQSLVHTPHPQAYR